MNLKVLGLTNVYMILFYYIEINYLNHHQSNESIGFKALLKLSIKMRGLILLT
jgi:hypothetical protein